MDNFGYVGQCLIGETFDLKFSSFTGHDNKTINQVNFKLAIHVPKYVKKTNSTEIVTVNKTVSVFGSAAEQIKGYGNGAYVALLDLEYTPYNFTPQGQDIVRGVESYKAKKVILISNRAENVQAKETNETKEVGPAGDMTDEDVPF
jgi:hypothetical protein